MGFPMLLRTRSLCWSFIIAAVMLAPARSEARRYTLSELLAKVAHDYVGVTAAREGEAVSQAQIHEANRLWAPTGMVTFGITGSPDIKCVGAANPDGSLPSVDSNQARREQNCINTSSVDLAHSTDAILPVHGVALNLGVNLVQPLYTFGKIEAAQAAAHAGYDLARGQTDVARNDARLWAVRAYFGLKWARAAKSTLGDGIKQLDSWVKKIDDQIDKGDTHYSISDVTRLKIALDNAKLVGFDIDRGLDLSVAGLRLLTNDPEADVDDQELGDAEIVDQPLDFYQDAARTHRPEARMLEAGTRAAKANRKLKLANMLPDIGLTGSFNYGLATGVDTPQNAFMSRPNTLGASLLLGARVPLDIAVKLGQYDEARAQERQLAAKREQALGGIGIEIRKAWLDFEEARQRREVLEHAEKVARGWYNATDQALNTGVAEPRDLSESARNYVELRLRHLQALMDQNINLAALRNSAGILGTEP
jgi:outer membrane protein TolC